MEILSSTDWSFNDGKNKFTPDTYIKVGKAGLNAKIKALSEYKGIIRKYPHPRSQESLEALATIRGSQVGRRFCESFQTAMNIFD